MDASAEAAKSYLYDGEGRMIESRAGGAVLASYGYDMFGQRVSKTTASGGGVHYIHDDHSELKETKMTFNKDT